MFLHAFHPHPVLFVLGPLTFYWYGLFIALAVFGGYLISQKIFKRYQLPLENLPAIIFYLVISGIIGARLWHVINSFNYYLSYPWQVFQIWQGGLAIHGAVLGSALALYYCARRYQINFWLLADIFVTPLVLGQALGRWGNYFNQELYGQPTASLWSVPIDLAHRLPGYENFNFFQPLFLYESAWCLILFIFLLSLHFLRTDKQPANSLWLRLLRQPGLLLSFYLIFYSLERFLIGFWRIDPQYSWLNLRLDQWLSILLAILGLWLLRHLFFKTVDKKT